jgi:uncharacterized membrane protein
MFPPVPAWDAMHPLVVHFPIALLLVAPLFVVMAGVWRRYELPLGVSALVLMALGAGGAFVAAATGEAAEGAAKTAAARAVLERHEELAEVVEATFAALTAAFAAVVFLPRVFRRRTLPAAVRAGAYGVFLVAYAVGCVALANTAHQGGRLVHELGVRAAMTPPASARGGPAPPPRAAVAAGQRGDAGSPDVRF